ncbi:MAG: M64 family metallopeptidase [Salinivirgaceae bacterium]|nr:M64 family metallopeptidase [Salinivirgaceae bacterium]
MKYLLIVVVLLSFLGCAENQESIKEAKFANSIQTMRFDFYHHGNAEIEYFTFDEALNDGPWAGNSAKPIDNLRLGKYLFEVKDGSGSTLYSQGFASIYGEWETTPEAKKQWGVYHESLRFPWPDENVKIVLYKRNDENEFDICWEYDLELTHYKVNHAYAPAVNEVFPIKISGNPTECIDIVVLGEGYTLEEKSKFLADAHNFSNALSESSSFSGLKNNLNIRAVFTPSATSGCNHPHQEIYKGSALGVTYGAFDSERYALTTENKTVRNIASAVPYEFTAILMNDSIYGGGGIYNLYITAAASNDFKEYLFVHEFGHHFADLADEYYTSATSYEMGGTIKEPWELNVTIQMEHSAIKWNELIDPTMPLPTPWDKEKFDTHSIEIQKIRTEMRKRKAPEYQMTKLFRQQQNHEDSLFKTMENYGKVGLFEGAQYHALGVYRSAHNCTMFTRTLEFCPACVRAFNLVGERYLK